MFSPFGSVSASQRRLIYTDPISVFCIWVGTRSTYRQHFVFRSFVGIRWGINSIFKPFNTDNISILMILSVSDSNLEPFQINFIPTKMRKQDFCRYSALQKHHFQAISYRQKSDFEDFVGWAEKGVQESALR